MLEGIEGGGELALVQVKDGQIKQQPHIIRREDQRLPVLIDGVVRVAFGDQELRSGVVRGGNFVDRYGAAGARVGFKPRQVGEIDGVIVNRQANDVFISAHGFDLWRR